MGAQGHTTVDFGAFPGKTQARGSVTGQASILAASDAEAWVRCEDSADHSAEEHGLEDMTVQAISIVAATGFTVVVRPKVGRCYGLYNISWVWN